MRHKCRPSDAAIDYPCTEPAEPCRFNAGSDQKIAVMIERVARGESPFSAADTNESYPDE